MELFEIVLEKCEAFVQKSHSLKKIFQKKKNRKENFVAYVLIYSLSKFWGNRKSSL